jgi:hypothetical protein
MLDSNKTYCGMGNIDNLRAYMENLLADMIVVPNSWLPESYHNKTTGGRTLAKVASMYEERTSPKPTMSDHERETREATMAFYTPENIANERSPFDD